jgi:hypothetical protein
MPAFFLLDLLEKRLRNVSCSAFLFGVFNQEQVTKKSLLFIRPKAIFLLLQFLELLSIDKCQKERKYCKLIEAQNSKSYLILFIW